MATKNVELRRATWKRYYVNTYTNYPSDHPIKERRRAYSKKWAKNNKDKTRKYALTYRKRNRLKVLVRLAKNRAKTNGIPIDVKYMDWLATQTASVCECCGIAFRYDLRGKGSQPQEQTSTLDRINQKRGYIVGNVGIICWRCNRIKSDATILELKRLVAYADR